MSSTRQKWTMPRSCSGDRPAPDSTWLSPWPRETFPDACGQLCRRRADHRIRRMLLVLRRLSLGLSLIASASAILLLMDLHRRSGGAERRPEIAILQQASVPVLDDGVR